MALSERVTTDILISATVDTNHTRIGMAALYALGIKDALSGIDWPRVNKAILARWSRSGFVYIKRHAWNIIEGREYFSTTQANEQPKTGQEK